MFGTNRTSNHTRGRAVDIWAINRRPVVTMGTDDQTLLRFLEAARDVGSAATRLEAQSIRTVRVEPTLLIMSTVTTSTSGSRYSNLDRDVGRGVCTRATGSGKICVHTAR